MAVQLRHLQELIRRGAACWNPSLSYRERYPDDLSCHVTRLGMALGRATPWGAALLEQSAHPCGATVVGVSLLPGGGR